ncbi:MAG: hypothetical protein JXA71_05575, partial [Chitinispirillaceae bacterium]|nr:hypothetical protein [Chitinispirillaceae bacterium]
MARRIPVGDITALVIAAALASCARLGDEREWNNPFDPGGTNWHPPVVTAPRDTSVAVNDSVSLVATGSDDNGTVVKFWWSFDRGTSWPRHGTPGRPARHAWGGTNVGPQVVWVRAQDNDGIFSSPDSCRITVHDYRPLVRKVNDTLVSQFATVAMDLMASDTNGTIVRYLWRTGKNGRWTDSSESPRLTCSHPEGGAVTVVWAAQDDDGFVSCDTFTILFNRGPVSVAMLSPADGDTAAFISFDWIGLTGSVRLRFSAQDPDGGDDTLTYALFLGSNASALSLYWTGRATELVIPALDPSASFAWKLIAKDLFGDSTANTGSFRTPRAPNGPAGMTLIRSKGKSFQMGLPGGDSTETPVHTVAFSRH